MIEFLETVDRTIVLGINSLHFPFMDEIMWWLSARITWIPFYIFCIWLFFKNYTTRQVLLIVAVILIAVAISDLISVYAFKNIFQRYRPSHNLLLTNELHFYKFKNGDLYKGGEFGFISSHAANFAVILSISYKLLNRAYQWYRWLVIAILFLVCFSRIYLGVHYLSDVLVGVIVGALIGLFTYMYLLKNQMNS